MSVAPNPPIPGPSSASAFVGGSVSVLPVLRDFARRGQSGDLHGDSIVFGALSFPRKHPSGILSNDNPPVEYLLDSLWLLLEMDRRQLLFSVYLNQCLTARPVIRPVAVEHYRTVVDFLRGKRDTGVRFAASSQANTANLTSQQSYPYQHLAHSNAGIGMGMAINTANPLALSSSGINAAALASLSSSLHAAKRPRYELYKKPLDQWTESDILAEEEPFSNRDTILDGTKKSLENVLKIYERAIDSVNQAAMQRQQQQQQHLQHSLPHKQPHSATGTATTSASTPSSSRPHAASQAHSHRPAGGVAASSAVSSSTSSTLSLSAVPNSHQRPSGPLTAFTDPRVPIIIVPSAISSLLTLYNAADFLQNGLFALSEDRRRAALSTSAKRDEWLEVQHASIYEKGRNVKYCVVDDQRAQKFPSQDYWRRVVGIFVSGATWQFKGWPWPTPAAIFNDVSAFHLYFDDDQLNANIKSWNVKKLAISKTKRYQDTVVATDFWNHLSNYLQTKAPVKKLLV